MNNNDRSDSLGRLAYSVREAATVTGLGKTTLYSLMEKGQLPFCKVASRRLIRSKDLEAFIAGSSVEVA